MSTGKAYGIAIALLIIGLIIGYAVGIYTAPAPPGGGGGGVTTPPPTGLTGEVKVGALLSLTGTLSTYGENSEAALELAEKDINSWLKAIGEDWTFKIAVEDTATDPTTAVAKIQALHGQGILFFIGPMTSAEVSEIKSYTDANGLVVISQSSTSPALAIAGDSIFRFCPTDEVQGPAAARTSYDLGIRWVVPFWRGDTWGDGLEEAQKTAFNKILQATGEDGGFVEGIRYDPSATEFSTQVAQLADIVQGLVNKYGADKVGIAYIGFEEVVAVFTAAKDYPILSQVKWVGSDGTAGLSDLVTNVDAAEFSIKTWFLSPIFAPAASPFKDKVKNYVHQKLGRDPDSYAYAAYDAAWVFALALEMAKKYDANAVKKLIPEIVPRYMGASGNFRLDANGDRASADYELWIPRKTAAGYEWAVAGVWLSATDTIQWQDWWVQFTSS
jgi:branched-chain amino acid transport system substrate-binding protein